MSFWKEAKSSIDRWNLRAGAGKAEGEMNEHGVTDTQVNFTYANLPPGTERFLDLVTSGRDEDLDAAHEWLQQLPKTQGLIVNAWITGAFSIFSQKRYDEEKAKSGWD